MRCRRFATARTPSRPPARRRRRSRPPPARPPSADRRQEERAALTGHLAGDHEALDFLRALVDLRDLRVAHEALDGVLLDIAVAAEDLDGLGRRVHRDVSALEL